MLGVKCLTVCCGLHARARKESQPVQEIGSVMTTPNTSLWARASIRILSIKWILLFAIHLNLLLKLTTAAAASDQSNRDIYGPLGCCLAKTDECLLIFLDAF